ncbi:glutamate-cysteine ligase modifier subunit [Nomia melanderi]|uniref:glutamate-cysteine ligase modifier subunit n=1 Tax=Nomia melanderi TaxID=2448451 RepID=UPI0013046718|nr:glutamate--cysteine ligase regulatory subunit [Nomia melanderi]
MLSQNVLIYTGNILSLNEPKTKTSQNPTDELIETLKIVLQHNETSGENPVAITGKKDSTLQDVIREEVKITVKVFMSSTNVNLLKESIDEVCNYLNTSAIESLVIAYSGKENSEDLLSSLKQLWIGIEEYVEVGKLSSVGLSDISTNIFIDLFQWAKVKPNIVQISLATCCVVPPALQSFTKENDVQLLTHNDSDQIIPAEELNKIFNADVKLYWVARYQIHVKCRGILSSKGYLVYMNKTTT